MESYCSAHAVIIAVDSFIVVVVAVVFVLLGVVIVAVAV